MTIKPCQARQYSDQMICGKCGVQWDVDDPEPPVCPKRKQKEEEHEKAQRVAE